MDFGEFDELQDSNKLNSFGFSKANSKKQEAVNNDRRLQDLATYAITKGLTEPLVNIQETLPLFSEYKKLVKRGSFTVEELEDRVISQYGIVNEEDNPFADMVFLDEQPEPYYKTENNNE